MEIKELLVSLREGNHCQEIIKEGISEVCWLVILAQYTGDNTFRDCTHGGEAC